MAPIPAVAIADADGSCGAALETGAVAVGMMIGALATANTCYKSGIESFRKHRLAL